MSEIYRPDKVTKDFLKRSQAVSLNRWDTPYGSAENDSVLETEARGAYVYGPDGQRYLDWNNGILSKIFDYRDRGMEKLIMDQVKTGVLHTSSVFLNKPTVEFKEAAARALEKWGDFVILPASSGTIADSMALRIALGYVKKRSPSRSVRYVIPAKGYSGADFRGNAMCGLEDWKGLTTPDIEGVQFIEPHFEDIPPFDANLQISPHDVEAWFRSQIGWGAHGPVPILLIEAGELGVGGFRRMSSEWMQTVTWAVKRRDGIVICDCVQTLPERSDKALWGFERWLHGKSDAPDIVTTAKGLGDGLPIALTAVRKDIADAVDGKWFDTFAANPIAAVVAKEVLRRAQTPEVIQNVDRRSAELDLELKHQIAKKFPATVYGVVGARLMTGLAVDPSKLMRIRAEAQKRGLLVATGSAGTIRLAPHLDATEQHIQEGVRKLRDAVAAVS